jgi:hypothetical protein
MYGARAYRDITWEAGQSSHRRLLCKYPTGSTRNVYWITVKPDRQTDRQTGRQAWVRVQLKCDGTQWRTGGEVKEKQENSVGNHKRYMTAEHGPARVVQTLQADVHSSAASSQLNWCARQFKWTHAFCQKTKSGFCTCAITFQTQCTCAITFQTQCTSSSVADNLVLLQYDSVLCHSIIIFHNPMQYNILIFKGQVTMDLRKMKKTLFK